MIYKYFFSYILAVIFFFIPKPIYAADLHYGDEGDEISVVQRYLYRIGQSVEETGVFDDQTLDAVRFYQYAHFLPVSGDVDDLTCGLMFGQEDVPENLLHGHGNEWIPILILQTSERFLGIPYVWGGASPETGFDCSGFVQYVFAQIGVSIPRTADEQFNFGYYVDKSQLLPGDLVFFETYEPGPSHIGIYYNMHYFIHADSTTGIVTFDTLDRAYREETYLGARRMFLW